MTASEATRKLGLTLSGVFFALALSWGSLPAGAETCNVPSASYPSIQSAVNVINCTEIVLASGNHFGAVTIGRTLTVQGAGSDTTTVLGKVTISGSETQATLKGLKIAVGANDLPHDGLVVVGDAEVIPDDLVIASTDLIFSDGFEWGNTAAWSAEIP